FPEADVGERRGERGRRRAHATQLQRALQVLLGAQVVLDAREVAGVEQVRVEGRAMRADRFPVPQHRAAVQSREPRHAAQQRRLAAAVRAAHGEPFARGDSEGDLAEEPRRAARAGEGARLEPRRHGSTLSTTTFTSCAPGFTMPLEPTRSPGCGMALPEREMRASMRTDSALESLRPGDIACESSSVKRIGSSRADARTTASGMRGPCSARANTKIVADGSTRAASLGEMLTEPATAPAAVA